MYSKAKQIQLLAIEAEMRVLDMTQEVAGDLKITAPIEFKRALCRHIILLSSKSTQKWDFDSRLWADEKEDVNLATLTLLSSLR
ncbi:hypothetical protein OK016_15180 [Vibrio chagasii]|nr:hypothetical protein [Vibrio chagasii]